MSLINNYVFNILISIDQFGNTLVGGNPDETISSRCGKAIRRAKTPRKFTIAYWLNAGLDKIQKNHCIDSIEDDEKWHILYLI